MRISGKTLPDNDDFGGSVINCVFRRSFELCMRWNLPEKKLRLLQTAFVAYPGVSVAVIAKLDMLEHIRPRKKVPIQVKSLQKEVPHSMTKWASSMQLKMWFEEKASVATIFRHSLLFKC